MKALKFIIFIVVLALAAGAGYFVGLTKSDNNSVFLACHWYDGRWMDTQGAIKKTTYIDATWNDDGVGSAAVGAQNLFGSELWDVKADKFTLKLTPKPDSMTMQILDGNPESDIIIEYYVHRISSEFLASYRDHVNSEFLWNASSNQLLTAEQRRSYCEQIPGKDF